MSMHAGGIMFAMNHADPNAPPYSTRRQSRTSRSEMSTDSAEMLTSERVLTLAFLCPRGYRVYIFHF
jgi:hypothetical protein